MMRPGCKGMDVRYAVATDIMGPVAILWDIENCCIPAGVPAEDVAGNIRTALRLHPAVKGAVTVFSAYGDFNQFPRRLREGCQRTGVNLIDVPSGRKDAADKAILVDMFLFAIDNPPPSTIFLITGDIDFSAALHKLGQRGFTVVLGVPAGVGISPALCSAGTYVWDWPSLARGEGLTPAKWTPRLGWFSAGATVAAAVAATAEAPSAATTAVVAGGGGGAAAASCPATANTMGNSLASTNGVGGSRTPTSMTTIGSPNSHTSNSSPCCSPPKIGMMLGNGQIGRDEPCAGEKAVANCGSGDGGRGGEVSGEDGAEGGESARACRTTAERVGIHVGGEGAELSSSPPTAKFSGRDLRRDGDEISTSSPTRAQLVGREVFVLSDSERFAPFGSLSGYQSVPSRVGFGGGNGGGGGGGGGNMVGNGVGLLNGGTCGGGGGGGGGNRGLVNGYVRQSKKEAGWSPAAPSDLVGLKQQIVKLLVEHGGKLDLVKVPPEYRKAYGRPLYLSEYGASKLTHLVEKMEDAMFVSGGGMKKMVLLRKGLTGGGGGVGAGAGAAAGGKGGFGSTGGVGGGLQNGAVGECAFGGGGAGINFSHFTNEQQQQEVSRKRETMAGLSRGGGGGEGVRTAMARENSAARMLSGRRLGVVGLAEAVDPMGVSSHRATSDDDTGEDIFGDMSPDEEGDEIIMLDEDPRVVENRKRARDGAATGIGVVGVGVGEGSAARWTATGGYVVRLGDGDGAGGAGVAVERETDLFGIVGSGRCSQASGVFPDGGSLTPGTITPADRATCLGEHPHISTLGEDRWTHHHHHHHNLHRHDDEDDHDEEEFPDDGGERFVSNGEVCAQVGLEIFRREVEELLVSHACKITTKTFPELYRQRYARELDYSRYGVFDLISLIQKVSDVALVVEDEATKAPCVVASF
ncbi:hypothetical protein CBR_g45845 [Chara braunii]|uniref:HTH OST-type domain-containing protein n=1 Tax=Chara braunii TaxID=69332 RepID=A0A388LZJ9_CHABU|nr:hypothetical protein CBR_g45845 [Chara braunii]|eukprot:GBG87691.1 hypothetical protein CBR_g45845 [Chara braunii]